MEAISGRRVAHAKENDIGSRKGKCSRCGKDSGRR